MHARCGRSLLRTLSTTIAPERTYRWEKTRQSHDRFNRLKKDRLWRSVRSVDCTIATNAQPRTTKSSPPTQKAQTSPCLETAVFPALLEFLKRIHKRRLRPIRSEIGILVEESSSRCLIGIFGSLSSCRALSAL